jgi:hypothetical protein
MIIGHDQFDAVQTACLESEQKIPPARAALTVGELDRPHPRLRVVSRKIGAIARLWQAVCWLRERLMDADE